MIQLQASAVLTDIEGTTTAIDFVHKTLFPYARQALPAFVQANHQQQAVATELAATAELAQLDPADTEAIINTLLQWIDEDRKATPLKNLQGMVWRHGYENGDFRGHIYPDAHAQLTHWHASGLSLQVYSSGSVAAQQLLFGYSDFGDMRPLFSGWYDTLVGGKREVVSYQNIAQAMQLPSEKIIFLSDVGAELDAAAAAGMQCVHLVRSPDIAACGHPQAEHFHHIEILPAI